MAAASHMRGMPAPRPPPPSGLPSFDVANAIFRPLRPDDVELYPAFLTRVSAEDRRRRFFTAAPLSASQIRTLTRYDPAAAAVFVAVGSRPEDLMGVGRLHRLDGQDGEFAVLVRSDLKGQGLGRRLLERVIEAAPGIGVGRVVGLILRDNTGMLALAGELGFSLVPDPLDPGLIQAELALADIVAAETPDQLAAQAS